MPTIFIDNPPDKLKDHFLIVKKRSFLTIKKWTLAILALILAGCAVAPGSSAGTPTPAATPTPGAPAVFISSRPGGLGNFLVDGRGMVLYINSKDSPGTSTCSGACAQVWPPLEVTGAPVAGKGVPGLLGSISRPDGRQQVTYDGWPLYNFTGDARPGYASGDGFGGVWFAAVLANPNQLSLQPLPRPNNLPGTNSLSLPTPHVGGNAPPLQNPAPLATPRPNFPRFPGGGGRGRR
jgi:predicted lipoprotein with Yx(FWY)xxD motif